MKNNIDLAKELMWSFVTTDIDNEAQTPGECVYPIGLELIYAMIKDGYEISADWKLFEIPTNGVYSFWNEKNDQAFDMVYCEDEKKWKPGYITVENNKYILKTTTTIKEAIKLDKRP